MLFVKFEMQNLHERVRKAGIRAEKKNNRIKTAVSVEECGFDTAVIGRNLYGGRFFGVAIAYPFWGRRMQRGQLWA